MRVIEQEQKQQRYKQQGSWMGIAYRSEARVATTIDQFVNRVRVVDEVGGHGRIGKRIAVVGDEGLEVVRNRLRRGAAHAVGGRASHTPVGPRCGRSASCES